MGMVEDLKAARALIDAPEKWCKNKLATWNGPGHPTSRCAVGAISSVVPCMSQQPLMNALVRALPKAWGPANNEPRSVASYNDDPATSHTDVLALFDSAIHQAEGTQR